MSDPTSVEDYIDRLNAERRGDDGNGADDGDDLSRAERLRQSILEDDGD